MRKRQSQIRSHVNVLWGKGTENNYSRQKKDEKRKLISHIVLDKIDNYKTNDRVGVDKIYLNNNLLYQEDIYIIKEKNKTKNIFTKIKEWYSD